METVQELAVAKLKPSPFNPRRIFDQGELEELAGSIREHGIQSPVVVRKKGRAGFEIIFGHRRVAAAELAELETVPAIVRTYTDRDARQVQIIENLQRADVHPLDEADGFKTLRDDDGLTPAEIANKVGMSESHVAKRIQLTKLGKPGRDALDAGRVTIGAALVLARVEPAKLQNQVVKALTPARESWETMDPSPLTEGQARHYVNTKVLIAISGAPWKRDDATLVPKAGACAVCPKRTGAQTALFDDVDNDLCLDTTCFRSKLDAHWETIRGNYARAVDGKQGQRMIDNPYGAGIVRLDEEIWIQHKRRKVRPIAEKAELEVTAIQDPRDGRVYEYVSRAAVEAAGKGSRAGPTELTDDEKQQKERERKRRLEERIVARTRELEIAGARESIGQEIADNVVADGQALTPVLDLVVDGFLRRMLHDDKREICVALELEPVTSTMYGRETKEWTETLEKHYADTGVDDRGRLAFLVELALRVRKTQANWAGGPGAKEWRELLKAYGVDSAAAGRQAKKELTPKPKAKKKAPAKRKRAPRKRQEVKKS